MSVLQMFSDLSADIFSCLLFAQNSLFVPPLSPGLGLDLVYSEYLIPLDLTGRYRPLRRVP